MFRLVPEPLRIKPSSGRLVVRPPIHAYVSPEADEGARLAFFECLTELRTASQKPVYPVSSPRIAHILCVLRRPSSGESYEITVSPNRIQVEGDGQPGVFYGLQTLRQLIRQFGSAIPCCRIHDQPKMANRAFYLDASRGRVPRLETLRQLVNLLAHLKYNQLQLYVEHVFPFAFDPAISEGCDVLTPHEIRALDEYCRIRHIRLVPSLACFGHMGRVLSLPAYRELAEAPWPAPTWQQSRWVQRLRGATINPRHPGARKLLRAMLNDFLPCFSAPLFNMCGDETYDLGRGANRAWAEKDGMGKLYALHVRFLHKEAARHGKRLMLWGDMLLKYPDAIRRIPDDCIVLDWGYEPTTDFSKVRSFLRAGLNAYVCPSTRGYRVVFNEVEKARANIAGYAREASQAGAHGLLVTDWGDMGHFNLPAASLHGMALGAATAWNPRADSDAAFDRAFALQLFGDRKGDVSRAFRQAGSAPVANWPLMLTDLPEEWKTPKAMSAAEKTACAAAGCAKVFAMLSQASWPFVLPETTLPELALACGALKLTAEKVRLFHRRNPSRAVRRAWAETLMNYFHDYAATWRRHYKLLGLSELKSAFERACRSAEGVAQPLTRNDLP